MKWLRPVRPAKSVMSSQASVCNRSSLEIVVLPDEHLPCLTNPPNSSRRLIYARDRVLPQPLNPEAPRTWRYTAKLSAHSGLNVSEPAFLGAGLRSSDFGIGAELLIRRTLRSFPHLSASPASLSVYRMWLVLSTTVVGTGSQTPIPECR